MTGSYRRWERIVVFLCLLDLAWFVIAFRLRPPVGADRARHAGAATCRPGGLTPDLMFLVIAIVGTTVAPWQLFFQQSCIADKRLRFADVKWARLDTLSGRLHHDHGGRLHDDRGQRFARCTGSRSPIRRRWRWISAASPAASSSNAILLLMINAAVLGTTAISLSSAWAYGEVRGWPHSLQLPVRKAPGFYAVYLVCVAAAAGLVLIPGAPLQLIILGVQVLAGVMLPSAIIFLQLLLNDKELLGEYANKPWNNLVNWTIIIVLFALSLILAAQVAAPNLFPAC